MATPPDGDPKSSLVLSYLGLRKAVGIIGVALPFTLVFGKIVLEGPGIEPSISHYYYTIMRNVFVGSLCAIAVFLMSYRGYERKDDIAGDLACTCAIGVALLPATPAVGAALIHKIIGFLHFTLAAALFLTLAYFCLALFRKTDEKKPKTRRKQQRDVVYTACGWIILACIALLVIYGLFLRETFIRHLDPVFWLESAAVIAFGISWFVKGEGILQDTV